MNKQEVIDKLKAAIPEPGMDGYKRVEAITLTYALELVEEIGKVTVPQFVADWIEWCKKNKITLLGADTAICNNKNIRILDASGWAWKNQETFVKAWIYGYEVKEEKLYTVEIPIANSPLGYHYVLRKTISGKIIIDSFFTNNWGNYDYCQLTEEEIKKDHGWAWKYAEEVKE